MQKEVVCCCNSTINLQGYIVIDAGCRIHGLRAKSIQPIEEFIEETVAKEKSNALKHQGAIWGEGIGFYGNSYALPTKDKSIQTLPVEKVKFYIDKFIEFAHNHPELDFQITRIGCGLAGFTDAEIAPMFEDAPKNCYFDENWEPYFTKNHPYWGSF